MAAVSLRARLGTKRYQRALDELMGELLRLPGGPESMRRAVA